jgi:hypothetical protein
MYDGYHLSGLAVFICVLIKMTFHITEIIRNDKSNYRERHTYITKQIIMRLKKRQN